MLQLEFTDNGANCSISLAS